MYSKKVIVMKDEILTVVIFILLCALFTVNSRVIHTASQNLTKDIDETAEVLEKEDYKSKEESFKKLSETWDDEQKKLFYLCHHSVVAQIDENINLSRQYAKDGNEQLSLILLKKARILLEDLSEREKFRLDNIF